MATKNTKVAITNNDQGPRYVHTARGVEIIQSGAVLETEVNEAQLTAIEDAEIDGTDGVARFTVEGHSGNEAPQPAELRSLSLTALRKLADAEDVQLTGRKDEAGAALPDIKSAGDIADAIQAKRDATQG